MNSNNFEEIKKRIKELVEENQKLINQILQISINNQVILKALEKELENKTSS